MFFNKKNDKNINNKDTDIKIEDYIKYKTIYDLAPDGILVVDMKGIIISVNEAYYELTGTTEKDVIGKHIIQLPATQKVKELPQYLKIFTSVMSGKDERFEFRYRHTDGSLRWGEGRATLFKTGLLKGGGITILRDITKRKTDEEALLQLMNELERSNRELDDYTYAVSHDLKAPLRTIESFSSFIKEDYSDKLDETGKEYFNRIQLAAQRMTELIDDLLLISRVGRKYLEKESVDLNIMIQEVEESLDTMIKEKKTRIIVGELPVINTQVVWIKQLFTNLISNGLKFNKSSEPIVWVNCEERINDYLFSIKDNGIGIDKKYHDRIFKIFQRLHTREEYPGTGAGLTICQKIVNNIGGKIWLESKVGRGTTFYFTVPKEDVESEDDDVSQVIDDSMMQLDSSTILSRTTIEENES